MSEFELASEMIAQRRTMQRNADLNAEQAQLLAGMSFTLTSISSEMGALREMTVQGLAMQQEALNREQMQDRIEEFIFRTEQMVKEFRGSECSFESSERYFLLDGVLQAVEELGIGTPIIKGRDNKEAFEHSIRQVREMRQQLLSDSEVKEALAWVAKEEEKRIEAEENIRIEKRIEDEAERKKEQAEQKKEQAERKKEQAERKKEQAERKKKVASLTNDLNSTLARIDELKTSRKTWEVGFGPWYKDTFSKVISLPGPLSLLGQILMWWLCCAWIWMPIMYLMRKVAEESAMNSELDAEIKKLKITTQATQKKIAGDS